MTVLPSLTESESFGMTLVEAMASGCPVVGSAVGGIPFVVRDDVDGLLVPPGDAGALADALAGVLTDPARAAALGAAGREAARARWDWSRQEDRTIRVLDEAARPGRRKVSSVMASASRRSSSRSGAASRRPLLPLVVALRFRLAWSRLGACARTPRADALPARAHPARRRRRRRRPAPTCAARSGAASCAGTPS